MRWVRGAAVGLVVVLALGAVPLVLLGLGLGRGGSGVDPLGLLYDDPTAAPGEDVATARARFRSMLREARTVVHGAPGVRTVEEVDALPCGYREPAPPGTPVSLAAAYRFLGVRSDRVPSYLEGFGERFTGLGWRRTPVREAHVVLVARGGYKAELRWVPTTRTLLLTLGSPCVAPRRGGAPKPG